MPRFHSDLHDAEVPIAEVPQHLSDLQSIRIEIRRTLPALLHDAIIGRDKAQFRTDVRDEEGKRVLTATILMVIDCVEDPGASQRDAQSHDPATRE